jgi:HAD superfamily hydrolase (TIGR01456 family)
MVFDIDGVVLRGYDPLPHARESLARLTDAGVPYIFVTNGGGELESSKADKLSSVVGMPVHPEQVVLSHTPLRPVVQSFAHQKCLILGCRDVMGVARAYGGKRLYSVPMLTADEPLRYPFVHYDRKTLPAADREEPFGAVFILHDPADWAPELQVAIDVIRGGWPLGSGGNTQKIPVFASNPDLVFAGVYPVPRLACGAYITSLKHLWHAVTGTELDVTLVGKPTKATFDFARGQLGRWARMQHESAAAGALAGGGSEGRGGSGYRQAHGHSHAHAATAHGKGAGATVAASHGRSDASAAAGPAGAAVDGGVTLDHIFMVGDNPAADIRGANAAGGPWKSLLVRTGVFQGGEGDNDRRDPAHRCVAGIREAVDYALSHQ